MIQKQTSKEIGGREPESKTKKLLCTRTSDFPGVGLFRPGDVVEDQRLVSKIADNPNFEEVKG